MIMECEQNLTKSGFTAGQRLGLVLPNSPLFLASCAAVWRLGGTVVPVSPQSKYPRLHEYLEAVGAAGAVVSRDAENAADTLARAKIPFARVDLSDAIPEMPCEPKRPDEDSANAVLFHTGGATGVVKAVPITHANIAALLVSIREAIPAMNDDDVVLNAIPNYHSLGFVVGGILPLASGIPQVLPPPLTSTKNALAAIRSSGVTIIPALPIILGILLGGDRNITPMTKVKMVFCGGGELSPAIAERAREAFGVKPLAGYGLTEASSVLAVTPSEKDAKPGSSGRILSCFEAKVVGEDGQALPPGADGRLWIKGGAVARGYYGSPELSAGRFKDGWFDTQDIVRVDESGFITIVAPSADVITVEGMRVYTGEIEAVLREHPEIKDAAVVGVPRGERGEYARAYVTLEDGSAMRPREIVAWGRSRLPNYKAPRSVKIVGELPTNGFGKVLKHELRGA
jgi:long-chain acyl-CoA synthetase